MQRIPERSESATAAAVWPSLDELAREGARRMLVAALEAEVADYVARFGEVRDECGHAEVVRNGHGQPRKVTVGAGTLEVYVWADGVPFNSRLEDDRLCSLVIIGARPDGTQELIAVEDGYRESTESWL